ncbi:unnamed protein product [Dracunculus medinensis]|uniref:Reverse transcriptase domain-containing protein n=1 Tax=Dracunculus medinensis TaxID=318479 RepID=A0A0N4UQR2_DRAME|nr:unnamed protein product [Dracunculus medinensis]
MDTACRHSRDVQISLEHCMTDLEYADDVVLFANNYDEMQVMLNNVSETAAKIGSESTNVEEIPDFKYLGSTLVPNDQAKDDIIARITAAKNAFFRLTKPLCRHREITINTKDWSDTVRKDLEHIGGPAMYGLRRWKKLTSDGAFGSFLPL